MQLTLDIPDNKASFFMEVFQNFSFVKVSNNNTVLTAKQEADARQTLQQMNDNPESLSDWEDVKKRLDPDAC